MITLKQLASGQRRIKVKTFVFAIYLDGSDLVEIKVTAKNYGYAISKVKRILHHYVNTEVTGLYLNDEY